MPRPHRPKCTHRNDRDVWPTSALFLCPATIPAYIKSKPLSPDAQYVLTHTHYFLPIHPSSPPTWTNRPRPAEIRNNNSKATASVTS